MGLEETGVRLVVDDLDKFLSGMKASADSQHAFEKAMYDAETAARELTAAQKALESNTDPAAQRELTGEVLRAQVAYDQAAGKANGMATAMKTTTQASTPLMSSLATLSTIVTGVGSAMQIAGQVADYLKKAYELTIGTTVEYASQVRELGRVIGASAEQASMLIQAADDVRVEVGTLQTAMESAIRKGYSPTIDGLAKIADKYNSLPTQIERTAYAMDVFGRSGAEMIPLLEKGSAGIRAMGDEAKALGLTLTDQDVVMARLYEKQVDDLGDLAKAWQIKIGNGAIPMANAYLKTVERALTFQEAASLPGFLRNLNDVWTEARDTLVAEAVAKQANVTVTREHIGALSDEADAMRRGADMAGPYKAALDQIAAGERQAKADALAFSAGMSGQASKALDQYGSSTQDLTTKQKELAAEVAKLEKGNHTYVTVAKRATGTVDDLTDAQLGQELAARRLADAQAKLAANSDPAKARALENAVLSANIAYRNSEQSLGKATEAMATSTTAYINNDKALQAKRKELQDTNIAIAANAAAQEEATARIVMAYTQQAIAAVGIKDDPRLLIEMAHATGVLSEADYELQLRLLGLAQEYKDSAINRDQFIAGVNAEADALNRGLTPALAAAADAAARAAAAMANMPANWSGQDWARAYTNAAAAPAVPGGPTTNNNVTNNVAVNAPGGNPATVSNATSAGVRDGMRARGWNP